ncbi:HlyD family type I secretion periplasmic adaptor subunit [Pseudomonas sp. 2FG]|uniref:HlyD family type I secretion periplasmic adaptor subunit n=1 Tax=Pseudomonas sp. 2FG TaxID=2502191 RepID=UPI0010F9B9DE|nr:HlyD family type I secretion periplasmic adaptor subunit [Pseudomonas sp. 2FG]
MKPIQNDLQTDSQAPAPDTDAAGIARFGLWLLALGFGGFLLWAGLAPLDQGVVGSGTVVVSGERKTVQSLLGGAIERILVREGEQVRQGQVVVQLNTIQAQSQLDVALGQWLSARSVEARLIAERLDRDSIDWPQNLLAMAADPRAQAAMELQGNLFATRRDELASRLKILQHEEESLAEQLAGFEEIKRNHDAQLKYQRQELEGLRELAQEGYVPRNRLFEAERNAAQLGAQQAAAISDIGRTRQAINESKLKTLQQAQAFRSEAESQLTQVAAEASSLADRIKALDFEVRNGSILASVAGQVMGLAVHTVGGVVPAGQRLMDLVPQGSSWVVKAQFPPLVADRLKPGLPVDVRFASLQRVNTPVMSGKVTTVSADQLIDEHSRLPYFSVEVEVSPEVVSELRRAGLDVKPGMQVEVIIKTGERTLMNYLMKPVTERLVGAFKEE